VLRKPISFFFLLMVGFVMLPVCAGAQTATESVLYSFCGPATCPAEGDVPKTYSGPIQAADGNFYGNAGVNIYKLTPSGTVTSIPVSTGDGYQVSPGLIQASDGNFYGSLQNASGGVLSIFQLTPGGTVTTIYDNLGASAALTQGADGKLYGIWAPEGGTFFSTTLAGNYTQLYQFCDADYPPEGGCTFGSDPIGSVLQGADGNFYGVMTSLGSNGCSNCGGIFGLTPSGSAYTVIGFNYAAGPASQLLVEDSSGGFYGTTGTGQYSYGAVFLNSTQIYAFCGDGPCGVNGYDPNAGVIFGPDGNLYGTTLYGGTGYYGTVFKLTPAGALTTIYNFCSLANCADGSTPVGSLTLGSDGNIYGVTSAGGANNGGVIFKLALTPTLAAPVQLALSPATVDPGNPATLSWSVPNAYSTTAQQCYAFVQNGATGAGTWTGLQTGTLTNGIYSGSATITPTVAGAYTYALTCGGTESGFATLQVGGAKSATTTTLSSNSPVVLGGLVTLRAASTTAQSVGPLTGTVAFSYGSLSLGTVSLSNGAAGLNVTAQGIPTGTYPITASYSGDSNYQPSVGTANVTVLGYATGTNLTASTAQVTQGQAVTLLAAVARSSVSGMPSGNVTFSYGSSVLGTAKLVGGAASFTASTNGSIPPGTYAVTAKYGGDATDQSSVSAPVNVTVIAATSTSLTVSPTTVPKNSAVMLTSVVARKYDAGVPTGSVTFSVGSHFLGTQALDGTGTAVVNASSVGIAAGTYPVTATYSGDAANAASSATVDVTVE
jgi:uncharacterized repeat protein (TIGR03803 family)